MAVLREVHARDGYPSEWPDDTAAFLTPRGMLRAWVGFLGGVFAGHVVLTAPREPVAASVVAATGIEPARLAVVARLFVHPACRGRGLAELLLGAASAEARRRGRVAFLDVVEGSYPAIRLYERLGWRRAGSGLAPWTLRDGQRPRLHYYVAPEAARRDGSP